MRKNGGERNGGIISYSNLALHTLCRAVLSIAVMPLIKPDWWEKHQPLAVAFWSVLFIVPFAAKYGMFTMGETVLECVVNDYLTFIILLFGLFCVAGNITIDGEFAGSPRINTALFVLGTLLFQRDWNDRIKYASGTSVY